MALLEWTPQFSVNIGEIDRQHQRLFALLNELYDAMRNGQGKKVVGGILTQLLDYTDYHFATEERLFALHDYPGTTAHVAEHRALTMEAQAYKRRFEQQQVFVTSELLTFLKSWLNHHISGSDQKYAAFLRAKGVQ